MNVVVNLFLHYLAAYGRLVHVQSDLFGTITQSTFTLDTLCACVVTFDLILTEPISALMPDSHKFVHYHWIRVHINHARAEIARAGIRYGLFQKQEKNHLHQQ